MLYSPDAHEPLVDEPWDEERARAAIRRIAAEAANALGPDGYWPVHPADGDPGLLTLYLGATGMVWGLAALGSTGHADIPLDLGAAIESTLERYGATPDFGRANASLWMGETGIALVAHGLTGRAEHGERVLVLARDNATSPAEEIMWGAPGTMLATHAMYRRTGDERFADAWAEGAERLWGRWGEEGLWVQTLHGKCARLLGPAHGAAGNIRVLAQGGGFDEALRVRVAATYSETVVRTKTLANWPAAAGLELTSADDTIRTQWCHGAPGIVASLWDLAPEELMLAGGALTWKAGPLRKGPGFCHGTAGNGYAFLKLFALTGDEKWLDRACAFAVHALAQVDRERDELGRGRFTLFTGDVGVAIYVRDCLEGSSDVPTIDTWA